jgi:hypothetical protein
VSKVSLVWHAHGFLGLGAGQEVGVGGRDTWRDDTIGATIEENEANRFT